MKVLKSIYINANFYRILSLLISLWVFAFVWSWLTLIAQIVSFVYLVILIFEGLQLYRFSHGLLASRKMADRFSNGDANQVVLKLTNKYNFLISLKVVDEVPFQFQWRENDFELQLEAFESKELCYHLRPTKRGPYHFGKIKVYASFLSNSLQRAFVFEADKMVKTYPSFLDLRRYELKAFSNSLTRVGQQKLRKISLSREFEKIDRYVEGDDYRRINWKATARTNHLMVNHYQDERSQNVVSVIDKGRSMQMPFNGLSLLDYAINATLVLSNIVLKKADRAGMVSVQHKIEGEVLPEARNNQMLRILETLYAEKTSYKETDMRALYKWCTFRLKERSLLMLYTNFESVHALHRQLAYLKLINQKHRLLVIFFINEEVEDLSKKKAPSLEDIYRKGLAEDLLMEKRQIAAELAQYGIEAMLTRPGNLTADAINRYLDIKNRGLI